MTTVPMQTARKRLDSEALELELIVDSRSEMDEQISAAVDRLVRVAFQQGRRNGISVSRLGDRQFSVALDENVPFGVTEELDLHANGTFPGVPAPKSCIAQQYRPTRV
jgi:hypothetical protein